jgi:hypothetical protein
MILGSPHGAAESASASMARSGAASGRVVQSTSEQGGDLVPFRCKQWRLGVMHRTRTAFEPATHGSSPIRNSNQPRDPFA